MGTSPARVLTIDEVSLKKNPDPRFRRFLGYWQDLAAASGGYPQRLSLDPIGLGAELIPNLFLVDILKSDRGDVRYRYRLLGEAILAHERTRKGDLLDEIAASDVGAIERHYEAAIAGRIYLRKSNLGWHKEALDFQHYWVLALPLSDDGKIVTHLAGLCIYDR